MNKTVFHISKMDCPSEEATIRMALADDQTIRDLQFDLDQRRLTVIHDGDVGPIQATIHDLKFGDELLASEPYQGDIKAKTSENKAQLKMLWTVLGINAAVFAIEIVFGLIAQSMGLISDALDELSDALVYGMSIYAISGSLIIKKRVARVSGILQVILALAGFYEIIRRFFENGPLPDVKTILILSGIALLGNVASLVVLTRSKSQEVHIKASQIFTSNDVIANIGIMIAGVLVYVMQSRVPDLLIGAVVFALVLRGAVRIFKIAK
jgi:Co/Zn/Cd efflux system component